jgi:hypothetical protein
MYTTEIDSLKTENIVFSNSFQGTHRTIVPVGIRNEANEIVPLIIKTPPNLLSFGIQEIKNKEYETVVGYQMPICLWGKRDVTVEERQFTTKLQEIVDYCRNFLVETKDELKLNDEMIRNFNILNWKYENGVKKEDKGPILYTKLINNRNNNILTYFVDEKTDNTFEPLELLNTKCLIRAAIKVENIIIGNRISLQLKLCEVQVRRLSHYDKPYTTRSLLNPNIVLKKPVKEIVPKKVEVVTSTNIYKVLASTDDEESVEAI